jgi:hypothetical protein
VLEAILQLCVMVVYSSMSRSFRPVLLILCGVLVASRAEAQTPTPSTQVTWTCSATACPWGQTLTGHALIWPQSEAASQRLGYVVSGAVYLPASIANGLKISLTSGRASIYAGPLDAPSHRLLTTILPSGSFLLQGLGDTDVISVQGDGAFSYAITEADPGDSALPDPSSSSLVNWTCTGSTCPWGSPFSNHAIVWSEFPDALSARLGYSTSAGVYLPAAAAKGLSIKVTAGTATVYAGPPDAISHRTIAKLTAGQSYRVLGLGSGEVISVQNETAFAFETVRADDAAAPALTMPPGGVVNSVSASWRCNIDQCHGGDWKGSVIAWPAGSAYDSNGRAGDDSRSVYSNAGELLYPYMGRWAHGCEVTAKSGVVLIVEWQRGTDRWRSTLLSPGDRHTIRLKSHEDGALIETEDNSTAPFSVSFKNCNPQTVSK